MFQRIEVEFLSGPEDMRDRRTFEKVKTLEFVTDSHLRIVSMDDGELVVKWNRLQWYHSQPLSQLDMGTNVEQQVLAVTRDATGKFTNIILGIKKHRELTGMGLKESKEYVERLRDKYTPF